MKKGDTRREQILTTAESLFYTKGYEQTSIQDLLNTLHLSKGGFYHYFDSKLALLEAITSLRAEESHEAAQRAVYAAGGDPIAALNAMLDNASIFKTERIDYISLLLRVAYREDGALVREKLKQRTMELMLPMMDEIIAQGVADGLFSLPHAQLAGELVLRLCAQFTDDVAKVLARSDEETEKLSEILAKLELYRHAIERLLNAPFGSIVLYDMKNLAEIARGVAVRHR